MRIVRYELLYFIDFMIDLGASKMVTITLQLYIGFIFVIA